MKLLSLIVSLAAVGLAVTAQSARGESLTSAWQGDRIWLGPDWYAGPLQDWSIVDGKAVVAPRGPEARFAHVVSRELTDPSQGFFLRTTVALSDGFRKARVLSAGLAVGVRGTPDNLLHAVVYPDRKFLATLTTDGGMMLGEQYRKLRSNPLGPIRLELTGSASANRGRVALALKAFDSQDELLGELREEVGADTLRGAVGLHARIAGENNRQQLNSPVFARFDRFECLGAGIRERPKNRFGPVLWSQYSYANGLLRVQAQFPPLAPGDAQQATLQIQNGSGTWRKAATADIEPASSTALFEVRNWDSGTTVPYRVAYVYLGETVYWPGAIRREPPPDQAWQLGLFSCDNGRLFPLSELTEEISERDPDLLFFAGDQFYESFGGFGIVREPLELARLDYLRKWYLFGWTNREILRDRPSIIIPDDHDVFQGNLWGQGGRELSGMPKPKTGKLPFTRGGYAMEPDWVHLVERSQTGHLPPPYDPTPVKQGIGVYYTGFSFGGVSFAVLEDRKFKPGPQSDEARAGAETLLGDRQIEFLNRWAEDWQGRATIKIVLSQTLFAQGATHIGDKLRRARETADSNSWPVAGRNRALHAIRKAAAFSLHGDQHLALQVRHGIDTWEDAGVAFMGPATCVGFARAWWPETVAGKGDNPDHPVNHTGRFRDDYGHPLTVDAVANPLPEPQWQRNDPVALAMAKASGYAIIGLDPVEQTMTVNCYPLPYPIDPGRLDRDQYKGWPLTFSVDANDGRKPVGHLPRQQFEFVDPVIAVYQAESGELIYARRIRGRSFTPPVFAPGKYEIRLGKDQPTRSIGIFEMQQPE